MNTRLLTLAGLVLAVAADAQPARREPRTYTAADGAVIRGEEAWLTVPENRAREDSRRIEIHYVRLFSTAAAPGPPLVYLAGGPGNTGTGFVEEPEALAFWATALPLGDVVLLDQRGTRDADLVYRWDGPFPVDVFRSAEAARAHAALLSRRAVAAITARGVDLAGYTTPESVGDLEALREALGVERISLLGFSYGTHLALAYLRRHDAHVANVVLVGVEGPDQTLKLPVVMDTQFRRLAPLVARDPATKGVDLLALLERADRRLAAEPLRVTVTLPGGSPVEIPVGPFGLHLILRADIGDATDLPVFPRLLDQVARGDATMLRWFVQKRLAFALSAPGMGMMMDAASGGSPARLAAIAAQAESPFADVVNFPFPEVSPLWNPPALAADFHEPVASSARALFLSGEYDWNAPPFQAEEARWGFTGAVHLVVPNAGHEQTLLQNPAAVPVIMKFLAGEDVRREPLEYPPLRFVPLTGPVPQGFAHPSLAGG